MFPFVLLINHTHFTIGPLGWSSPTVISAGLLSFLADAAAADDDDDKEEEDDEEEVEAEDDDAPRWLRKDSLV